MWSSLAQWKDVSYSYIVDACSKWCEFHICSMPSSAAAIEKLRISFSSHGLPVILVSDHSVYLEFQAFVKANRILLFIGVLGRIDYYGHFAPMLTASCTGSAHHSIQPQMARPRQW